MDVDFITMNILLIIKKSHMCLAVNNKDKIMKLGVGARETSTTASYLKVTAEK